MDASEGPVPKDNVGFPANLRRGPLDYQLMLWMNLK